MLSNVFPNIIIQLITSILLYYYTITRYTCNTDSLPIIFLLSKISGLLIVFNISFLIIIHLIQSKIYIPKLYSRLLLYNILISSIVHVIGHLCNMYKNVYIINNINYINLEIINGIIITSSILLSLLISQLLSFNISSISSVIIVYHSFTNKLAFLILFVLYIALYICIFYTCVFYYNVKDIVKHNEYTYEYIIDEPDDYLINKKITSIFPCNTFIPVKTRNNKNRYSIISENPNLEIGSKLVFFKIVKRHTLKLDLKHTFVIIISDIYTLTKYIELFKTVTSEPTCRFNLYVLIKLNASSDLDFCLDLITLLHSKFFVTIYVEFNDTYLDIVRVNYSINIDNYIESIRIINQLPVKLI